MEVVRKADRIPKVTITWIASNGESIWQILMLYTHARLGFSRGQPNLNHFRLSYD